MVLLEKNFTSQNIVGISSHDFCLGFCETRKLYYLFYLVTSIKMIKIRYGARTVPGRIKVKVEVDKKILSYYARNKEGKNGISERKITQINKKYLLVIGKSRKINSLALSFYFFFYFDEVFRAI